jgi:hypothetical protein
MTFFCAPPLLHPPQRHAQHVEQSGLASSNQSQQSVVAARLRYGISDILLSPDVGR